MLPQRLSRLIRRLMAASLATVVAGDWGTGFAANAADAIPVLRSVRIDAGDLRGRFHPGHDAELIRLREGAVAALEHTASQQRARAQRQAQMRAGRPLAELKRAELDAYFAEPLDVFTGKDRRALEQLQRLAELARLATEPAIKLRHQRDLAEVVEALNLNRRAPIPARIDLVELPIVHYDYTHNPIAIGETPAWNLEPALGPGAERESSRRQPLASSFWARPGDVAGLDLFHGFGRSRLPAFASEVLEYHEPKTSFGGHAGFVAKWGRQEVKVKFGERHSEPFTARIFWALGYNVDPTDFVPSLKLRYDRRLFREFNQRRDVNTSISALGVPVYKLRFQPRHDPFSCIVAAVLKDGTRLASLELKARLLRDPDLDAPEDDPGNFRPEFEATIDHLVTAPANVQVKEPAARNLGPWSFGGLGHEGRRELRGAGLLAAWLGWSDSRFDNMRLRVVETPDGPQLRHYLTDLGGGLGRSTGLVYRQGELPNAFPWTFTRPRRVQGKGRMTIPFRVMNYEPIEDTPAFEEMTWDDARWMARWIGQLTESQLVDALIASGFDLAQVRLYTEKLISRRDQMLRDLSLAEEVGLLRPKGVDRSLDFDPEADMVVCGRKHRDGEAGASLGQFVVRRGEWRPREHGQSKTPFPGQ